LILDKIETARQCLAAFFVDNSGVAGRTDKRRDLAVTIDYRSVLAACVERAFGLDHDQVAQQIFY